MAIRVAPGAADLPADLGGRFLVLVRGAADPAAALAGLAAARDGVAALGPATLSAAVLSPHGPLLRVGRVDADEEALQTIPDLVRDALERHGVADATVELLEPVGDLDALDTTPNAAVLRLFPAPGEDAGLPLAWLEVATDWVLGDATADELVGLRLLGASFRVPGADAASTLHAALAGRAWCDLVHGDLGARVRTASLTFGRAPHLALAAGGPGLGSTPLVARFELLREVAAEVPGVAYACIDLEATFADVGTGIPGTGWPARGGADPNAVASRAGDVAVPDAFPFQLLGPGHLARLGPIPAGWGPVLPDGRLPVVLGDTLDWHPRFEAREDAVDLGIDELGRLLVTEPELVAIVADRTDAADTLDDPGDGPSEGPSEALGAASTTGPDLEHVTLEAVPRPRRGLRLTLLELAAWLAHEPHTDAPRSVSPVVAAYARWLASGLDHDRRQALKPYAAHLVGTRVAGLAAGPWRPLPQADAERADRVVDWLAREQAAGWLDAAGHHGLAASLRKVRRLADGSHRDRQLRLLDDAVVALRADLPVGIDLEEVWDAWERAGEASAWVAASEAAWTGVPGALASAAELRAHEVARGDDWDAVPDGKGEAVAAVRAGGGAAAGGGGAAAAAVAAEAWALAGAAASASVDADLVADPPDVDDLDLDLDPLLTAVPLVTAWERSLQGARGRLHLDRDGIDLGVETAEAAARALVADLVDGGEPPARSMDVARRAAAASAGGEVWRTVRELAQGVVGDRLWGRAERAAEDALDRVVRAAPPLVHRAVLVAMAREVASLAGRSVAARGGPQALEPVVDDLQPGALALLDALVRR